MSKDKIYENTEKLKRYLIHFGEFEFLKPNFDKKNLNYAGIKLTCCEKNAQGLDEFINKELNEKNGINAHLRFIEWAKLEDGKYTYIVEIIPNKNVKLFDYEKITDEYLHRLPKIIKNYSEKHCLKEHKEIKKKLKC